GTERKFSSPCWCMLALWVWQAQYSEILAESGVSSFIWLLPRSATRPQCQVEHGAGPSAGERRPGETKGVANRLHPLPTPFVFREEDLGRVTHLLGALCKPEDFSFPRRGSGSAQTFASAHRGHAIPFCHP